MALPAPLAMRQKCAAGFQSGLCRVGVISRRFLRVHVASGYPPKLTVNADSDSSFEQLATQAVIAARTEGENWIAFGRRVLDAPPAVAVQFGASTLSPSQISSRPRRAGIMSATRKASAGDASSRSISCSPLCSTMTSVLSISFTPPGTFSTPPSRGMVPKWASESTYARGLFARAQDERPAPHCNQLACVRSEFLGRLVDGLAFVGRFNGTDPFGFSARKGSPQPRAGEPIGGGPSLVVFVAQLEPTAAEPEVVAKFTPVEPEAAVAKFTSEPEAAVAKFTAVKSEAAMAKFTAVEREGSGSEVAAASKAAPAEAASAKVRPTEAVTEATSAAKGRRTQCRAGCGDRRGD